MQADPSHGDAANPSAHSSFQNASARIKKTSVKGAEISPWDTGMAPARRSAHTGHGKDRDVFEGVEAELQGLRAQVEQLPQKMKHLSLELGFVV